MCVKRPKSSQSVVGVFLKLGRNGVLDRSPQSTYYLSHEVEDYLKIIIAHNDAAVELGHARGIRIHELEQEVAALKEKLNEDQKDKT